METSPRNVLVVDDNPAHRTIVEFNLAKAGLRVTTAPNVTEALEAAARTPFDLVLTDYNMPDYTGTDLVKQLRATEPYEATPMILLTSQADELNTAHLAEKLLVLVLPKPCPMARLVDTVCKCLAITPQSC